MLLVGTAPKFILLGFMITTGEENDSGIFFLILFSFYFVAKVFWRRNTYGGATMSETKTRLPNCRKLHTGNVDLI
jgi:hypothetical protein